MSPHLSVIEKKTSLIKLSKTVGNTSYLMIKLPNNLAKMESLAVVCELKTTVHLFSCMCRIEQNESYTE